MRTYFFDQFEPEFGGWESEEELCVCISRKDSHVFSPLSGTKRLQVFQKHAAWDHPAELPFDAQPTLLSASPYRDSVVQILETFNVISELPPNETQIYIAHEDADEHELLLETPDLLICYYYSRSA